MTSTAGYCIVTNYIKGVKILERCQNESILFLPFKLFLDPVSRGSGKLETLISGKCAPLSAVPLTSHPVPATTWPTLRGFAADDLLRGPRRSTSTRANSTERRSSTATIMSLTMVTSSPWRDSRPTRSLQKCYNLLPQKWFNWLPLLCNPPPPRCLCVCVW